MKEAYLKELEKVVHDYRKHVLSVLILLEAGEYDRGYSYLMSLLADWDRAIVTAKEETGHILFDGLISQFRAEAKSKQIEFKTDLSIDGSFPLEDQHLTALLMNLWANAVKATTQLAQNRCIELKVQANSSQFQLIMLNSYQSDQDIDNQSVKRQADRRWIRPGRGLAIVQDIVKRYHGHYQVQWNSQYFIFQIVINQ